MSLMLTKVAYLSKLSEVSQEDTGITVSVKSIKIGADGNEGYQKTTLRRLCDAAAIHHCG